MSNLTQLLLVLSLRGDADVYNWLLVCMVLHLAMVISCLNGLLCCWPKNAFVKALDSVSVTSSCGILWSRLSLFLIADFQLTFGLPTP
jgi:hypothetical protein